MDKGMRCTVCTWRGTSDEARRAGAARPSSIPPGLEEVQAAYAELSAVRAELAGTPREPPCPVCGHHLQALRHKSIRPAM